MSCCCHVVCMCCAGGVWSEAALQCLEETTHSAAWKVLMLRILSREGTLRVQIIDTSTDKVMWEIYYMDTLHYSSCFYSLKDIDIAERLVNSGHAHWADPHPPYPHSLRYHRDGNNAFLAPSGHVTFPNTSESFPVYVSSVQTPNLVFVQVLHTHTMSCIYSHTTHTHTLILTHNTHTHTLILTHNTHTHTLTHNTHTASRS